MNPNWTQTLLAVIVLFVSVSTTAKPTGPKVFCDTYPDSGLCAGTLVTCSLCHTSTSPSSVQWNSFGQAILTGRHWETVFEQDLANVLYGLEQQDTDGDTLDNISEILLGSLPGDDRSIPHYPNPPHGDPNPGYNVDGYDVLFAYRRVSIVYCGQSPSLQEVSTIKDSGLDIQRLHDKLDACLQSDYWRNTALSRLADPAIKPINFGTNWEWDYRLFRYIMLEDRDMRELVSAQYHVREETPGVLTKIEGAIPPHNDIPCNINEPGTCAYDEYCRTVGGKQNGHCAYSAGRQPLAPEHRAGMLTTQWFHFINTMFSALPRQTAAQAYRAWLGFDIARQEGLMPESNEPLDVDHKSVDQAECAQCHSTLDPMSYVFASYAGIEGGGASNYDPQRPIEKGLWAAGDAPQSLLLGQPIDTLQDWGAVAMASEPFKRQLALIFYRHVIGHEPRPEDLDEFTGLWQSLSDDGFSANNLNHRLIELNAFGAP